MILFTVIMLSPRGQLFYFKRQTKTVMNIDAG